MVMVLGLLNNFSCGPQTGKGNMYSGGGGGGWGGVVSKQTGVIEKTAIKLSQSCHINKA